MTAVHGERPDADLQKGWTVDDTTFGARLALVRQRMGWNIKEAATACGIPPASWASWEAGALPRKREETCEKIAAQTGADYLWLMVGPRTTSGARVTRGNLSGAEKTRSTRVSAERPKASPVRSSTRPGKGTPRPDTRRPAMLPRPVAA